MRHSKTTFNEAVATTVAAGLASTPKSLPSWLFYNEAGDRLFQQIMRMPEYYPTRCEYDILQQHKDALLQHFRMNSAAFRLIELGAGDGLKTEILLKHFLKKQTEFVYIPVDISGNALENLSKRLHTQFPQLRLRPVNKSYEDALADLDKVQEKKVILFMGANIGNFTTADAVRFLKNLSRQLDRGDQLLIGFDLKKDPRLIQQAYDDPHGLTSRFNLNILTRLNDELGAAFDIESFSHFPYYDPRTGTTRSFLISMKAQEVYIEALQKSIHFDLWEPIQTEVSQKYDGPMITHMAVSAGLRIVNRFFDRNRYFCDVLLTPADATAAAEQ